MYQITIKMLEKRIEYLNKLTDSPTAAWTRRDDGIMTANIGHYHLHGAYGGYALYRMMSDGWGIDNIFRAGHMTKRDLMNRIDAYIEGIERTKRESRESEKTNART